MAERGCQACTVLAVRGQRSVAIWTEIYLRSLQILVYGKCFPTAPFSGASCLTGIYGLKSAWRNQEYELCFSLPNRLKHCDFGGLKIQCLMQRLSS